MFPDITPISEEIGAEITGVAGHTLNDPEAAARCRELVDEYGVVVFREARSATAISSN